MSIFENAYIMAATTIKATKTWQAFDATRRRTVRKALLLALADARREGGRGEAGDRLLEGRVGGHHADGHAGLGRCYAADCPCAFYSLSKEAIRLSAEGLLSHREGVPTSSDLARWLSRPGTAGP